MRFLAQLQNDPNQNFLQNAMQNKESFQDFLHEIGASIEMQNKIKEELETNIKYSGLYQQSSPTDPYKNGDFPKEKKHKNYLIKKKTELCKTYELGLQCPYGDKCSFAHGSSELRVKLLVPINYKTVKCRQFHEEMYCHYGPRCQFLHKPMKPQPLQKMKITYSSLLDFWTRSVGRELLQTETDGEDFSSIIDQKPNVENMGLNKLDFFKSLRSEDEEDY
jgi:hypothetical protein